MGRARSAIADGVTEIWLSSEDTGAYGIDIGTSLSELLRRLTAELEGTDVMMRVGMTNPPYMLAQLDNIAAALKHPNVFSFLHVPVQAGSDKVLTDMNREYLRGEFETVADSLLAAVPHMTLATDVICGFPGESDQDFEDTMTLVEKYRFPVLNISQFYARPGTPAAKMRRVPNGVAKARSRRLTRFFEALGPHKVLLGQELDIWINTESTPLNAKGERHTVGHTKSYVKVLVPFDAALQGSVATVRVVETHRWHVVADLLSHRLVRAGAAVDAATSNARSAPSLFAGVKGGSAAAQKLGGECETAAASTSSCACGSPDGECCSSPTVTAPVDRGDRSRSDVAKGKGESKAIQATLRPDTKGEAETDRSGGPAVDGATVATVEKSSTSGGVSAMGLVVLLVVVLVLTGLRFRHLALAAEGDAAINGGGEEASTFAFTSVLGLNAVGRR